MKEPSVECTHCRVVMTSWSAPGSTIRYFQCPFCQRTHSSLYGEVFRRRAGARFVDAPARSDPHAIPMATAEEMHWARVKQTASRWFARLDADERSCAASGDRALRAANAPLAAPTDDDVPELAPGDVVEVARLAPASRRRG
ncbi:MAG TPA: hypothetical protein VF841_18585 [Anaeromyxobacter sp.]